MGISIAVHALGIGGFAAAAFWCFDSYELPQFGTRRGYMSLQLISIASVPESAPEAGLKIIHLVAPTPPPAHPPALSPTAQPIERQRQRALPVLHKTSLDLPAPPEEKASAHAGNLETESEAKPLESQPHPETKPRPLDKPLLAKTAPAKLPPLAAEAAVKALPGPRRKASPGQLGSIGSTGSGEYEIPGLQIVKPKYPNELRPYRLSGTVLLELTIGSDGWVKHARLIKPSTHPTFDRLALEHARLWRGSPARRNGHAIQTIEFIEVIFPAPI